MNVRSIEFVIFTIVRLCLQHVEQELATLLKHLSWPLVLVRFLLLNLYLSRGYKLPTLLKHMSSPLVLVRFLLLNIYLSRGYKLPTLPEKLSSRPVFIRVRVDLSLLCNSLSFLSYFFWPLYCLYFFDLWSLMGSLNFSYRTVYMPSSNA
jgi:hypothetical protein